MSFKFIILRRVICAVLAFAMLAMLCACSSESGTTESSDTDSNLDSLSTESSDKTIESLLSEGKMFTDRDKDSSFDESTAVKITLADDNSQCSSNAVSIDGNVITISDEGTYIISGSLSDGQIKIEAENTDKLQLVLQNVSVNNNSGAPLYVKQADKVFLTIPENTESTLTVSGSYTAVDDNNIDGAIFSKDDLTINGSGTLNVTAKYGHGIVAKDDFVLVDASLTISSADHGIQANDSIRIASGALTVEAVEDGLHSENSDDDTLGFVYIAGGSINMSVGDDGIHAGTTVEIVGGSITISKSYEGIEGLVINVSGGEIDVTASDDGFNAAGGNDQSGFGGGGRAEDIFSSDGSSSINITGGKIKINASGDGIDSNGDLTVSGGETYVSGPTNSGNGALDYAGNATISGGIFVAVGSSGMAQNFGSGTQGAMLVNFQSSSTDEVTLTDSSGNVLASFTPDKQYNSVLISTPEVKSGESYTLNACGTSQTVEMTNTIYTSGGMGGGFAGANQQGGGFGGMSGSGGMGGARP